MAAGAETATGDWLLFLHADTRPQPGWNYAVKDFMAAGDNLFKAGYFQFILNDSSRAARRLESLVHWRCRTLALPYGDQGLLISREFYDFLGGFSALPLMEDVEMARNIGRRRLCELPAAAVTSAERYRREGYLRRTARNFLCVGLYFVGFSGGMNVWPHPNPMSIAPDRPTKIGLPIGIRPTLDNNFNHGFDLLRAVTSTASTAPPALLSCYKTTSLPWSGRSWLDRTTQSQSRQIGRCSPF